MTDYIQKGSETSQYTVLANRIQNAVKRYRAVRQRYLNHRAMETASEGISLVEPDGTFSYVNPAFAGLFEYDTNELVDRHWTVLYHNEEADRLKADILPAIPETGYWAGETVRLTKHGDRLITDHRLASTDEDVIVCAAKDVTGERTGSPEQNGGIALLVDALEGQAFFTLDHERYVTRWNEGAKRLEGYDTEEILGVYVAKCFTEDDRQRGVPEQLLATATDDGVVAHEGWQVRGDGSRFWSEVTIAADYDGTGTIRGYAVAVRESTRQPDNQ